MRFQTLLATLMVASAVSAFSPASTCKTDALAAKGLENVAAHQAKLPSNGTEGDCTLANAAIRREW